MVNTTKQVWVPKKKQKLCTLCLRLGHLKISCTDGPRCKLCDLLGHLSFSCPNKFMKKGYWIVKKKNSETKPIPNMPTKATSVWVVKKNPGQNQGNLGITGQQTPIPPPVTDLWNAQVLEVEQAADATTDGGNDSPDVVLRTRGPTPTMAYLSFMKYYIYKETPLTLTDSHIDSAATQTNVSLIVSTQLNDFFMSGVLYSAWPTFWSNCTGIVITKRSWTEAFDKGTATIFSIPETSGPPPSKRARLKLDLNQPASPEHAEHIIGKPKCKYSGPIQLVPVNDANLRRSKRTTKYDGFKVTNFSERRTVKSKVAPCVMPSIATVKQKVNDVEKKGIPEPTAISTIQQIGVHMCGIDASELSPAILQSEGPGGAAEGN